MGFLQRRFAGQLGHTVHFLLQSRTVGSHVAAACFMEADRIGEGSVLNSGSHDEAELMAYKNGARVKMLIGYNRGLARKSRKSSNHKLRALKATVVLRPYKWTLARLLHMHGVQKQHEDQVCVRVSVCNARVYVSLC